MAVPEAGLLQSLGRPVHLCPGDGRTPGENRAAPGLPRVTEGASVRPLCGALTGWQGTFQAAWTPDRLMLSAAARSHGTRTRSRRLLLFLRC